MKYPLLRVSWIDSWGVTGWNGIETLQELSVARNITVGYRVKQTKESITLVQTINTETQTGHGLILIPKGCIKRTEKL